MKSASLSSNLVISNKGIADFPYSINQYLEYPQQEIGINEFEIYGLDRLQLLKDIENEQIRTGQFNFKNLKLLEHSEKYIPLKTNSSEFATPQEKYYQRRKDYLSHFILRLAFCQTEDLREWFIQQESNLFQLRWNNPSLRLEEKKGFIKSLNLDMEVLSDNEKNELESELKYVIIQNNVMIKNEDQLSEQFKKLYFKIPFENVVNLVQNRSVFIKKGLAYVPEDDLISLVLSLFKSNLRESLEKLSRMYSKILSEDEERLNPLLTNMSRKYIDEEYTVSINGKINSADIPGLTRYFPLCMQHLQKCLESEGHLRHGGRMQYGLFLKGIGMSLEESLKFWRKAFTKMTDDQFNKGYAYNIRHHYGKEGKGTSYSPYSCTKIIMSNPSVGDHHGCPFRHASINVLSGMLRKAGISENNISGICLYAKEHHYQLACTNMLTAITGKESEDIENVTHPNKYFDQCYPMSEYNKNKNINDNDTPMKG